MALFTRFYKFRARTWVTIPVLILLMFLLFHHSSNSKPHIPSRSASGSISHYNLNQVITSSKPLLTDEHILILTPLTVFHSEYWNNLVKLDFPHNRIDIGFIVPSTKSGDSSLRGLNEAVNKYQANAGNDRFNKISILRQDTSYIDSVEPLIKQKSQKSRALQKKQRSLLAKARNIILSTTISPKTSWVLWLSPEIIETPPSLIQDMAQHDKAVLVANAVKQGTVESIDLHSWQESEIGREMAASMESEDDIILEGFSDVKTHRQTLGEFYDKNANIHTEVPLDGVGASTAMLVKAEVHKDGAMFPPFGFYHRIESEGFAKMAMRLGYQPWGLPNYLVTHV